MRGVPSGRCQRPCASGAEPAADADSSRLGGEVEGGFFALAEEVGCAIVGFYWQRGYGIFSVSVSHLDRLVKYIEGQREHHRATTFQDEYRVFLKKYKIAWDERYVWD